MPFLSPLLLPLALACTAPSGVPVVLELQAELSEVVPTVPTVSGRVQGAAEAWVVSGRDGQAEQRVRVEPDADGAFELPLLGLKASSDYGLWLQADTGETSATVEVQTGSPPTNLAPFVVEAPRPDDDSGGFLVTGSVVPATAMIVDRDGDLVWWYQPEGIGTLARVRRSRDGQRMLMLPLNLEVDQDVSLVSVAMDGSDEQRLGLPYAHHDFVEHADGTLAAIAYDPREIDGEVQEGDAIVERAPDGTLRQVYSMWDHHDFDRDPPSDTPWPHGNALDLLEDPETGRAEAYLLSLLFLGGIARVDAATGQESWFLGGPDSTFTTPEGEGILLDYQHGMDLHDDEILVFVNGRSIEASSVQGMRLDPEAGVAETTWEYWPETELYNPTMGDVARLAEDRVLVTFSFNGVVQEIDASGELVWQLSSYLTGSLSYVDWTARLQAE